MVAASFSLENMKRKECFEDKFGFDYLFDFCSRLMLQDEFQNRTLVNI